MPVEIGSLVITGSFGSKGGEGEDNPDALRREIARLRRDLIARMEEMLAEAERRRHEP